MKLYTFMVPRNIRPTRLYALAGRMLPELPEYVIREAFVKRDVKVDGIRVSKNQEVYGGENVALYTQYEAKDTPLEMLYTDEHLLLVRKPVGVSCDTDEKGGKTLAEWVGEILRRKEPMAQTPLACHRLDNQTDGLVLLARDERTQSAMIAAFKQRQIHKEYICLVRGTPTRGQELLESYLMKDALHGRVRIVREPQPGAKEILTEYEVVEAGAVSRLRVSLHTGRTHQIRAQMAAIGHPILGDDLYGDRTFNREQKAKRLMLCATELRFSMPGEWEYMNDKHFRIEPLF